CALYVPFALWWSGMHWRILRPSSPGEQRRSLAVLGVIMLGEALGAAYVLWLKRETLSRSTSAAGRSLREVTTHSPTASDLFDAAHIHGGPAWSGGILEHLVYLGSSWLLVLVLCTGLLVYRQRRAAERDPETSGVLTLVAVHVLIAALFAWLCVGPNGGIGLYGLLYDHMPYWNYSRVPGRMIYIPLSLGATAFALTLTAALRTPRSRWAAYAAASLLIVGDLVARTPALLLGSGIKPTPTLAALSKLELHPDGALLYLPIVSPGSSQGAFWELTTTAIRKPFINGYSPAAPRAVHDAIRVLQRLNHAKLDDKVTRVLRKLHVDYIAYNSEVRFLRKPDVAPNLLQKLKKLPNLQPTIEGDGWHVFKLSAASSGSERTVVRSR
ncbi:MAG: hypothetical protein ABW321_07550, partial [Polyangiales bacterium]